MSEFQLEYDVALMMAKKLDGAAEDADSGANTMPSYVDGGDGTEFLLNILASLGQDAGVIAQVSRGAAERLRTTVSLTSGVDAQAEADFRAMEKMIP